MFEVAVQLTLSAESPGADAETLEDTQLRASTAPDWTPRSEVDLLLFDRPSPSKLENENDPAVRCFRDERAMTPSN